MSQRRQMKTSDIRREFNVNVMREDIDMEISLCGLCGNSGVIDTRKSAIWNGKEVGIIGNCVCENGRAQAKLFKKKAEEPVDIGELEEKLERQRHQMIFKPAPKKEEENCPFCKRPFKDHGGSCF